MQTNLAEKLDNVIIERTYNSKLVRSILSNPELLKRSLADNVKRFDPKKQTDIIYLLVIKNDEIIGVNVIHRLNNDTCAQIHVNYLPEFWGTGLAEYTKITLDWVFECTDFKKVMCFAPEYYPEVEKHALQCGLKVDCEFNN